MILPKTDSSKEAWKKIAPSWPLQNIIACNPLQGFENQKFENSLKKSAAFFENKNFPTELEKINQLTIKWCQVFFDAGQATIKMPKRWQGLYKAWKELAVFDEALHQNIAENIDFIADLPDESNQAILEILKKLELSAEQEEKFLTLILTTLSGWSSYVKYLAEWSYQKDEKIAQDYLAMRLVMTYLIWPEAPKEISKLVKINSLDDELKNKIREISENEKEHRKFLVKSLYQNLKLAEKTPKNFVAQFVFCIDVRSEPMRKAIENCGNYETFGFAGFFGIPTSINDELSGETYASCPVLLSPKHEVVEKSQCPTHHHKKQLKGYSTLSEIKKFYQSLKYNFTTPLPLAEGMGIWSGGWMFIKTFSPKSRKLLQNKLRKSFKQNHATSPEISAIPFTEQCSYAGGFLKAIGLTKNFSKLIILCGHGSQTENNTYATALDCGACGGRHGDSNAKILAKILNQKEVRQHLEKSGINIPHSTKFVAAKHNTTTDEIELYHHSSDLEEIRQDLERAKKINNNWRAKELGFYRENAVAKFFFSKSHNWSETLPEWGLARNASFIVAPRNLTKTIDLKGRTFLHSYDWEIDEDGSVLNLILNAPMIVAQWINSQYLFSTIDNVAFGSGSKITQNIAGKIGVMQGNASDLMNGLPLQSVYSSDEKAYHKPARLTTLVYAPSNKIDKIISASPKIQQLIVNDWIKIYCLDPRSKKIYQMSNDLIWKEEYEKF